MDLLCLMITASLLHRRVNRLRALLAAAVGGAYAAGALLLGLSGFWGFLTDTLIALALCAITFHTKQSSPWRTLKCLPILLLSSMTLGGIMTALYHLLNRLHLPLESLQGDGLSVWIFALVTAVSGVATLHGGHFRRRAQKTESITLQLTVFQKSITLHAMLDSGNLLRDPVSGRGVIVVDLNRLAPILPPALFNACRTGKADAWLSTHAQARITRLIPASGATGSRMLIAIIPEALSITTAKETYAADYLIAPTPLGEHAQGFDAIIPTE